MASPTIVLNFPRFSDCTFGICFDSEKEIHRNTVPCFSTFQWGRGSCNAVCQVISRPFEKSLFVFHTSVFTLRNNQGCCSWGKPLAFLMSPNRKLVLSYKLSHSCSGFGLMQFGLTNRSFRKVCSLMFWSV